MDYVFRIIKGAVYGFVAGAAAYMAGLSQTSALFIFAFPIVCSVMNIFVGEALKYSAIFAIIASFWWLFSSEVAKKTGVDPKSYVMALLDEAKKSLDWKDTAEPTPPKVTNQ